MPQHGWRAGDAKWAGGQVLSESEGGEKELSESQRRNCLRKRGALLRPHDDEMQEDSEDNERNGNDYYDY
jgi:hypothetical protein